MLKTPLGHQLAADLSTSAATGNLQTIAAAASCALKITNQAKSLYLRKIELL